MGILRVTHLQNNNSSLALCWACASVKISPLRIIISVQWVLRRPSGMGSNFWFVVSPGFGSLPGISLSFGILLLAGFRWLMVWLLHSLFAQHGLFLGNLLDSFSVLLCTYSFVPSLFTPACTCFGMIWGFACFTHHLASGTFRMVNSPSVLEYSRLPQRPQDAHLVLSVSFY